MRLPILYKFLNKETKIELKIRKELKNKKYDVTIPQIFK